MREIIFLARNLGAKWFKNSHSVAKLGRNFGSFAGEKIGAVCGWAFWEFAKFSGKKITQISADKIKQEIAQNSQNIKNFVKEKSRDFQNFTAKNSKNSQNSNFTAQNLPPQNARFSATPTTTQINKTAPENSAKITQKKSKFLPLLCAFLAGAFLASCAANLPQNVYIATSAPIYIDKKPAGKNFYVRFLGEGDLESATIRVLENAGYTATAENLADIKIKGQLNYLRKNLASEPSVILDAGFGFGRGYRGRYLGLGYYDGGDRRIFYDAQFSLFFFVGGEKYATNLSLQSDKSYFETPREKVLENFSEKIAQRIMQILNGF